MCPTGPEPKRMRLDPTSYGPYLCKFYLAFETERPVRELSSCVS